MPRAAVEPMTTITVRLPVALVDFIDREVIRLKRATPDGTATRGEALRRLLSLAKAQLDMEAFRTPRLFSDTQLDGNQAGDRIPGKTQEWLKKKFGR